ncbi:MAG TPA: aminotransferase class V-fold PLP-dependent enzyme, partial [Vampirovibrionales bacterium]
MIYCDNAATTQTDPAVIALMAESSLEYFGNPSSLHTFGQKAKQKLNQAREELSNYLSCKASEVIFTSSGTEGNNIAIYGLSNTRTNGKKQIITSSIEHSAVIKPLEELE